MKNAEWLIKNGYKFSDVHYCFSISYNAVNFYRAAELKAHLFKGGMKASSFLSTAGSARGAT